MWLELDQAARLYLLLLEGAYEMQILFSTVQLR